MKGYLILKPSRFAVNSSSHGEEPPLLLLCKNKGTSHFQTIALCRKQRQPRRNNGSFIALQK
jgi:hypothetical protein